MIVEQTNAILDKDLPLISNLANVAAILYRYKNVSWAGFYLVGTEYMYLGPFQGEVACTVIPFDKGVCGYAAKNKTTIIVPNVNEFKGHIACSSASKSEIVVPIIVDNKVKAVIDIDAPIFDRFHEEEKELLEEAAKILEVLFDE